MKLLLIGASSYVGARIFFDLKNSHDVVGTYCHNPLSHSFIKLDITDKKDVSEVFHAIKPEAIIHVANYPSPRSAINNEENFTKLNDTGTTNVVESANEIGAKIVFISSQAANVATDIYGKLKAKSETLVTTTSAGYLILRPSLILGMSPNITNPRPFNRILKCLDDRTTVGAFDTSWKLQPTYIGHLSYIIEKTITDNTWNKSIPVFIDTLVTQYTIARDILDPFGVHVTQDDQHISIPPSNDDLSILNAFNFSPHTYSEMIDVIIQEIKERNKFRI